MSARVNGAATGGAAGQIPAGTEVAVDVLLANLAEVYGHQLTEANIEVARWKSVAQATAGELAAMRRRVAELEGAAGVGAGIGGG